ncbi:MAG: M48 family metallopeptidase, partial [Pseudomonadales bacterium]|nr:M48 family metallopeptidase [Pseudomonadales bacterium]
EKWYRKEDNTFFPRRRAACLERFDDDFRAMAKPRLVTRKMKARWGSCSSTQQICLNSLLIQRPAEAIDYVITHELCHLRHFAHNRSFYRLLERVMPDWRLRAGLLETTVD